MTLPPELAAETASWSPAQKAALVERLTREAVRMSTDQQYPTAGALAQHIEPTTVQTPALQVIDRELEWALSTPNARSAISIGPQEGKTTRVGVWGTVRAHVQDPSRRIVISSYSDSLARSTSRQARNIIRDHGTGARDPLTGTPLPDRLGLSLADDKSAAGNWKLAGQRGGCYAVGVGGSLTGQPADVLIIDDPLKGMAEADSAVERDKVITWWESVAQTRLAPGAPVIIIMTRWHEDDLVGHVTRTEPGTWRVVNIPAVSTPGVVDALHRPEPGIAMESARGRTAEDFARTEHAVGPRVWSALYLGTPTPAGGGLFKKDDFNRHRVDTVPGTAAARLVSIDPAETGKRDESGILGITVTTDSRVWLTDDVSGRMQSDQWARTGVLLALRNQATELVYEAYTAEATYRRVIRAAWSRVRDEARILAAHDTIEAAAVAYAALEDAPADPLAALAELDGTPIPDQETPPFQIRAWRGRGDKVARASGARQASSTGRLRMVGLHPELEAQACRWLPGQDSPDRMDALSQGYERAVQLIGGQATIAVPGQPTGQTAPAAPVPFSFGAPMPSGL